jgi:hypothetical protein
MDVHTVHMRLIVQMDLQLKVRALASSWACAELSAIIRTIGDSVLVVIYVIVELFLFGTNKAWRHALRVTCRRRRGDCSASSLPSLSLPWTAITDCSEHWQQLNPEFAGSAIVLISEPITYNLRLMPSTKDQSLGGGCDHPPTTSSTIHHDKGASPGFTKQFHFPGFGLPLNFTPYEGYDTQKWNGKKEEYEPIHVESEGEGVALMPNALNQHDLYSGKASYV